MKRTKLGKALLAAAGLGVLAAGAARAQYPAPADPSRVVVIREAGKPDQQCAIEYAMKRQDGKTMYYVRDLATGERLRVLDNRDNPGTGPVVGKVLARLNNPTDAGMAQALAGSPAAGKDTTPVLAASSKAAGKAVAAGDAAPRTMTAAELAGSAPKPAPKSSPAPTPAPKFKPAAPAKPAAAQPANAVPPVVAQMTQLKTGATPSQREAAAMVLAVSDARTKPEVVKALMTAAQIDPAPTVRTTCVRCLYRISGDVPDVIPVIAGRRSDASHEVARTADLAMQEIGKRGK